MKEYRVKPIPMEERPALEEIVLLNTNIRGVNSQSKQEAFGNVIKNEKPHIICMNETKLQDDMFFD